MIRSGRFGILLTVALFAPPVFAQGGAGDVEGDFDPNAAGNVEKPIVIEEASLLSSDRPGIRVSGRTSLEEALILQILLRYPAADSATCRPVAWAQAEVKESRFEAVIPLGDRMLYSGLYEVYVVFSGEDQMDEETVAKYAGKFHDANWILKVGTDEEILRVEETLQSYYFVLTSLLWTRLKELGGRHDELVRWDKDTKAWSKVGDFQEAKWRDWLDGTWRPEIERISQRIGNRDEKVVGERYPHASNEILALTKTLLDVSRYFSMRIYRAHRGPEGLHPADMGIDETEVASPEDLWNYSADLIRSVDRHAGFQAAGRQRPSELPEVGKSLLEELQKALQGGGDEIVGLTIALSPDDARKPFEDFLRNRLRMKHAGLWSCRRPLPADGGEALPTADFEVDIRFLATDASNEFHVGRIRFTAREEGGRLRIVTRPAVSSQRVS